MGVEKRERLEFTDTWDIVCEKMSEGIEEANIILTELGLKVRDKAFITILEADDMNLRGQQLVEAFGFAENNMDTFIKLLADRSSELVDYVNSVCGDMAEHFYTEAVVGGASFEKREPRRRI